MQLPQPLIEIITWRQIIWMRALRPLTPSPYFETGNLCALCRSAFDVFHTQGISINCYYLFRCQAVSPQFTSFSQISYLCGVICSCDINSDQPLFPVPLWMFYFARSVYCLPRFWWKIVRNCIITYYMLNGNPKWETEDQIVSIYNECKII